MPVATSMSPSALVPLSSGTLLHAHCLGLPPPDMPPNPASLQSLAWAFTPYLCLLAKS